MTHMFTPNCQQFQQLVDGQSTVYQTWLLAEIIIYIKVFSVQIIILIFNISVKDLL